MTKEHFWTLDTAALTCFWTLYPRIQRGHWRFFGTPRLTKATRIIPGGERNTAGDALEFGTDWETKLTAPLSPVFCSQMSQSLENKMDDLRARTSFQRDIRDCNILCLSENMAHSLGPGHRCNTVWYLFCFTDGQNSRGRKNQGWWSVFHD